MDTSIEVYSAPKTSSDYQRLREFYRDLPIDYVEYVSADDPRQAIWAEMIRGLAKRSEKKEKLHTTDELKSIDPEGADIKQVSPLDNPMPKELCDAPLQSCPLTRYNTEPIFELEGADDTPTPREIVPM